MSSFVNILYPGNYLPDLVKVSLWVGLSAASSTILFGATHGPTSRDSLDWRDVALWGAIGATVGAQFAVNGRPWFRNW